MGDRGDPVEPDAGRVTLDRMGCPPEPAHGISVAVGCLELEQIVAHLLQYLKRLVPEDPHQLLEFFSRKIVHCQQPKRSVIRPNDMRCLYCDAALRTCS